MHDLYVSFDVKQLQKEMFRRDHFPPVVMNPQDANVEFIRDNVELVPIGRGRAHRGGRGLAVPAGVLCVVPGEVWGGAAQRYFGAGRGHQPPAGLLAGAAGVYIEKKITAGSASSAI